MKLPAIENLIIEIILGETEINVQRGKNQGLLFIFMILLLINI